MGESVKLSLIHIRNFVAPWVRGLIVSDNYPYTLWKITSTSACHHWF